MSAQRDLVIGVDVGGTTVKAALIGSDGLEYAASERPTPRQLGPDAVIATTIRAIDELRDIVVVRCYRHLVLSRCQAGSFPRVDLLFASKYFAPTSG